MIEQERQKNGSETMIEQERKKGSESDDQTEKEEKDENRFPKQIE